MKGSTAQKNGFTVIEVVLVLAIAGLIFLMIFVALPALNRSQRDAQRRDDMMLFLKKVKDYQTNNRGALPDSPDKWKSIITDYIGGNFVDPNGSDYDLSVADCNGGTNGCSNQIDNNSPFSNTIKIYKAATCDGEDAKPANNIRKIAIQYKLEGGGVYCGNS